MRPTEPKKTFGLLKYFFHARITQLKNKKHILKLIKNKTESYFHEGCERFQAQRGFVRTHDLGYAGQMCLPKTVGSNPR